MDTSFEKLLATAHDLFPISYINWSEIRRKTPPNAIQIREEYDALINARRSIQIEILKHHLVCEDRDYGLNSIIPQRRSFIKNLQASSFHLNNMHEDLNVSRTNVFLAGQPYAIHSELSDDVMTKKLSRPADKRRSERSIQYIIKAIRRGFGTFSSSFLQDMGVEKRDREGKVQISIDTDNLLIAALHQIHYEIVDNIDHWMAYPNNKRTAKLDKFGSTLCLQTTVKRFKRDQWELEKAKYSKNFVNYIEQMLKDRFVKKGSFQSDFSINEWLFFDNGRGVEENFAYFSDNRKSKTIGEIIQNRHSTRAHDGSGLGFQKVLMQGRSRQLYVGIRSGGMEVSNWNDGFSQEITLKTTIPGMDEENLHRNKNIYQVGNEHNTDYLYGTKINISWVS